MIMLAVRVAMLPDWLPVAAFLILSGEFQA